jgi:endonuclease YncB( thermonuclease family)
MEIRINGIDTPEMPAASYRETGKLGRAKCVKEAELALTARDALIRFIGTASVVRVYDYSWDKYGGRILGKVVVNQMDLATYMVIKGYAVAYAGGTKDTNWCE